MTSDQASRARQRVTVVNVKGLHARASAALSRLAGQYESRIMISNNGEQANARSIMDLLLLVAARGCEIEIEAEGPDAAQAVTAIASLVADGFGEDHGPGPIPE